MPARRDPILQRASTSAKPTSRGAYHAITDRTTLRLSLRLADKIRQPLGEKDSQPGVLYTARERGRSLVKIGFSKREDEQRVRSIITKCKQHVDQHFHTRIFIGAHRTEQIIHTYFESLRYDRINCKCDKLNKEWYAEKYDLLTSITMLLESWMKKEPYDLESDIKGLKPKWLSALWEWERSLLTDKPIHLLEFFWDGPNILTSGTLPHTPSLQSALEIRRAKYFGFSTGSADENHEKLNELLRNYAKTSVDNLNPDSMKIEKLLINDQDDFSNLSEDSTSDLEMEDDGEDNDAVSDNVNGNLSFHAAESAPQVSVSFPLEENSSIPKPMAKRKIKSTQASFLNQWQHRLTSFLSHLKGPDHWELDNEQDSAEEVENGIRLSGRESTAMTAGSILPILGSPKTEALNHRANESLHHAHMSQDLNLATLKVANIDIDDRTKIIRIPGQWPDGPGGSSLFENPSSHILVADQEGSSLSTRQGDDRLIANPDQTVQDSNLSGPGSAMINTPKSPNVSLQALPGIIHSDKVHDFEAYMFCLPKEQDSLTPLPLSDKVWFDNDMQDSCTSQNQVPGDISEAQYLGMDEHKRDDDRLLAPHENESMPADDSTAGNPDPGVDFLLPDRVKHTTGYSLNDTEPSSIRDSYSASSSQSPSRYDSVFEKSARPNIQSRLDANPAVPSIVNARRNPLANDKTSVSKEGQTWPLEVEPSSSVKTVKTSSPPDSAALRTPNFKVLMDALEDPVGFASRITWQYRDGRSERSRQALDLPSKDRVKTVGARPSRTEMPEGVELLAGDCPGATAGGTKIPGEREDGGPPKSTGWSFDGVEQRKSIITSDQAHTDPTLSFTGFHAEPGQPLSARRIFARTRRKASERSKAGAWSEFNFRECLPEANTAVVPADVAEPGQHPQPRPQPQPQTQPQTQARRQEKLPSSSSSSSLFTDPSRQTAAKKVAWKGKTVRIQLPPSSPSAIDP